MTIDIDRLEILARRNANQTAEDILNKVLEIFKFLYTENFDVIQCSRDDCMNSDTFCDSSWNEYHFRSDKMQGSLRMRNGEPIEYGVGVALNHTENAPWFAKIRVQQDSNGDIKIMGRQVDCHLEDGKDLDLLNLLGEKELQSYLQMILGNLTEIYDGLQVDSNAYYDSEFRADERRPVNCLTTTQALDNFKNIHIEALKKEMIEKMVAEILGVVKSIYDIQEKENPYAIRPDNLFFDARGGKITGVCQAIYDENIYNNYSFNFEGISGNLKKRAKPSDRFSDYALSVNLEIGEDEWFANISIGRSILALELEADDDDDWLENEPSYVLDRDLSGIEIRGHRNGRGAEIYSDCSLLETEGFDNLYLYLRLILEKLRAMQESIKAGNVDAFDRLEAKEKAFLKKFNYPYK